VIRKRGGERFLAERVGYPEGKTGRDSRLPAKLSKGEEARPGQGNPCFLKGSGRAILYLGTNKERRGRGRAQLERNFR